MLIRRSAAGELRAGLGTLTAGGDPARVPAGGPDGVVAGGTGPGEGAAPGPPAPPAPASPLLVDGAPQAVADSRVTPATLSSSLRDMI
ncbi:hypothetical protein GCM10010193_56910 [Kitasatospora atroaurantiaca]